MYTAIYTLHKASGMTTQEFVAYWRDVHLPIAAEMPGVRSLETFAVTKVGEGLGDEIDGFVILSVDSEADFERLESTPEFQRSTEDTRLFTRHLTFHAVDAYAPALGGAAAGADRAPA